MRTFNLTLLLAASAAAQSTVTILNFLYADKTLTVKGSDAKATTYVNSCSNTPSPSGTSGGTSIFKSSSIKASAATVTSAQSSAAATLELTPITAIPTLLPTAKARLRRQASDDSPDLCEPYTIVQGPSTYEFHLTDPTPGQLTVDLNCKWSGEVTSADLTCTATQTGSLITSDGGVSSSTINASELSSLSAYDTIVAVSASTSASGASTAKATGASTPAGSATAAPKSSGLAPSGPLPTGFVALAGGAAGLFAAAIAL